MFPSWLVRLVLATALGVLPLQGFAETVHVFLCQMQEHAGAHASPGAHASHDQHAHGHAGASDAHMGPGHDHAVAHHMPVADRADASDGAATEGHAGHFCCDVVVPALPIAAMTVAKSDFPRLQPAREVLHRSAFLEFPQRPPLL
ncbi:MAG: hypothetical protein ACREUX_20815 [Burkholderiales bacterium]